MGNFGRKFAWRLATELLVRQRRVWEIPQKLPNESGPSCNAGERARRRATGGQPVSTHGIWCTGVALGTLFLSCSTYSQELNGVFHQYLQRHGVPCRFVVKAGNPDGLVDVAICQDGREWALFWLEDEIAFVQPTTRELYKWDREVYLSYPELYCGSKQTAYAELPVGDGP